MQSRGSIKVALSALALGALLAGARPTRAADRPYDAPGAPADDAGMESATRELPPVPDEYFHHDGGWLKAHLHPSSRDRVRGLLEHADEARQRLRAMLGDGVLESVELRIAAVPAEMTRLAREPLPPYAGSIALSHARTIVMSATSPLSLEPPDLDGDFRHALAHLALDDATRPHALPRWLHEAFAVRFAAPRSAGEHLALAGATASGEPFRIGLLRDAFSSELRSASLPEAQAVDFVRFFAGLGDGRAFVRLARATSAGEPFERALELAADEPAAALEAAWTKQARDRYVFFPAGLLAFAVALALSLRVLMRARARHRANRLAEHAEQTLETAAPGEARSPDLPEVEPAAVEPPARRSLPRTAGLVAAQRARDAAVPKIEHGGRWHTLH